MGTTEAQRPSSVAALRVASVPESLPTGSIRSAAEALVAAIEARDGDTAAHSVAVVSVSIRILRTLDPAAADDPLVAYGFLLHDVGKLSVPDAVLYKPGPLVGPELTLIRQHPLWGAQILERMDGLAGTLAQRIVRHHHERWDGSGYPGGLAGSAIPSACRAFAVVDAFDAMTRDRPYRPAMAVDAALDELAGGRGTQFDPDAVDILLEQLRHAA